MLEEGGGQGVVGFVRRGVIHTYENYFTKHGPPHMAGHLAHEYAHLADFRHSPDPKPLRKHTVPYALGELVYDVCLDRFGAGWPAQIKPPRQYSALRSVTEALGGLPRKLRSFLDDRM
ncbi:MAG: hypothetical protein Q8Q09_01820 [Deltaproteobacteria bacterium]|nr:hypothetical protein [Deltaproteobacteria bacterium]